MRTNETAEKETLSKLASHHPECAFQAKDPDRTFSLVDGRPLYYWGSRCDLNAAINEAVGFGLKPQGARLTKREIAQAKKVKVTFDTSCFFFLFGGNNGKTQVELLELVSRPNAKKLVFRPTGHKDHFIS